MEIADKLRELRKAKGLTQEEMAAALFVTRQSVCKWETGKALPDLEKLKLLCQLFGVSADELLALTPNREQETIEGQTKTNDDAETPSSDAAGRTSRSPQNGATADKQPQRAIRRIKPLLPIMCVFTLLFGGYLLFSLLTTPAEIRSAQTDGMLPADWVSLSAGEIGEHDFLTLLHRVAALRLGAECPALQSALFTATNERLTREKAAYWLYCAHIWTVVEPAAALHFDVDVTEASSRDQWQDMNALGRAFVDSLVSPWEHQLCKELAQVGALFDRYDGSVAMDAEINVILDGRCYSSVAFCLAQRSFVSHLPLLETRNGSFRPKDHLTAKEAVIAVRRLYDAW